MHLRSVEIQGFKTFAKKTELLFEPGITAVVGPNGSGKSNLVDAIRWVLGERSARELRGSKMEEVVYSGGAHRQASGMAEVRLVIDNSDGRLPVPYSEVEVLRRGYRSGESEYWLNGARCRLRDIEELLASTGLTQEGYAVVAQDDVDHIIQTSAAERRALIEEAAGVRGLRHKRDDAMARIKESDITVLRLRDLAGELGPRVEELRRQAETARAEVDLTQRLGVLRGTLLRGEWLAARQRVKKASEKLERLQGALTDARSEANAADAAHRNQRERLARAHDARLARERQLGALRLAATEARSRLDLLHERAAAAGAAIDEATTQLRVAHDRLEELKAEQVAAEDDAAGAEAPVETAPDPALDGALEALATARASRQEVGGHAEQARQAAAALEARIAELEARRQTMGATGDGLLVELESAEAELAGQQAEGSEVPRAEADARTAAARLQSALEEVRAGEATVEAAVRSEREARSRLERLAERLQALSSLAADGDLPAPSAARLVELLERPAVRAAAQAAGIPAATLDAWLAEGRSEGRAISGALEQTNAEMEPARVAITAADKAVAAARAREVELRATVEARRQEHLSALAAVSAAAARESAQAQRVEVARHRVDRIRAALAERAQALESLADERERAGVAAAEAGAVVESTAQELESAVLNEAACERRVAEMQRAADQREAQRAALAARAGALAARRERAQAAVGAQVTEVGRARERLDRLVGARDELSRERQEAEATELAATQALDAAPAPGAVVDEVEELTEQLLLLEKENMERQVALAHHEDAAAAVAELLAGEEAALADLASRMDAEGSDEAAEDDLDWEKTQREISRLERQVAHLGPVNPLAIEEYERDRERFEAIDSQLEDLVSAREGLVKIADELTEEIDKRFDAVFGAVAFNFQDTFATLFLNGKATLKLDDPEAEEPGVEILAQPAGKRMRGIRLLSGGERALTALAFILALEKVNPSPFYIFDEVDAPLDDANVKRFNNMLVSMAGENQFILVTHNHATMTSAGALYGVTLEDSGVSRVVSVRLREGEVVPMPAARTS